MNDNASVSLLDNLLASCIDIAPDTGRHALWIVRVRDFIVIIILLHGILGCGCAAGTAGNICLFVHIP